MAHENHLHSSRSKLIHLTFEMQIKPDSKREDLIPSPLSSLPFTTFSPNIIFYASLYFSFMRHMVQCHFSPPWSMGKELVPL